MEKYKVGDVVLLRVKVREIREDGYGFADNLFCFNDGQFLAVLEPAQAEPAVAPRLTVGDWVRSVKHPELGAGQIIEDDGTSIPYRVEFGAGRIWRLARDVTRAEPPDPAPKPNPWRIVSEPPDSNRNVKVMLDDGAEKYGWFGVAGWRVWPGEPPEDPHSGRGSERTTRVVAWHEI